MKSVICVYDGMDGEFSTRLTIGKIYEVLAIPNQDIVFIKDDIGDEATYVLISGDKVWFEDATAYTREDKLNKLGICKNTKDYSDDLFWQGSLTIGKEYEVPQQINDNSIDYIEYSILNDYGFEHIYPVKCFVTKQELREEKLKELGI